MVVAVWIQIRNVTGTMTRVFHWNIVVVEFVAQGCNVVILAAVSVIAMVMLFGTVRVVVLRFVHLVMDGKDLAAEPRGNRGWMEHGVILPPGDAGKIDGLRLPHGCHFV